MSSLSEGREPLPRDVALEAIAAAEEAADAGGLAGEQRAAFMRVFRARIGWPVADLKVVRGADE